MPFDFMSHVAFFFSYLIRLRVLRTSKGPARQGVDGAADEALLARYGYGPIGPCDRADETSLNPYDNIRARSGTFLR
eukprot:scaffold309005_cov18-Prasinocladus_malaysianus.AAC.1